jgi:proton-translocating NADH-quinone oxidoreductase chain L
MNNWQVGLYLAAVLVPLAAFAVQLLLIRVLKRANALVATGAIAASLALSLVGLGSYVAESASVVVGPAASHEEEEHAHPSAASAAPVWSYQRSWTVLGEGLTGPGSPALVIPIGVRIDGLAALMFAMVTAIATLVHVYSMGYMHDDPGYPRFFCYLSLFCFSMLGLVAAPNVFQVFVFWEMVGICSYLLIGFWYEERPNSNAANKAFIVNRIGDAGMILGLGILWAHFGTFDMAEITRTIRSDVGALHIVTTPAEGSAESASPPVVELRDRETDTPIVEAATGRVRQIPLWLLTIAGLGIFAGCVGKSAQFPLHVWLPDAMAGPTPVSALIHAATMVAAGVYLVGRFYALFTPLVLLYIAYTGAITLFIGATIATVQTDYKKVLAYSTVSQLGFMMLGLGVGGWAAGLFHLVTHAFFKALLFLGAGSVYHAVHTYEMPRLGGLRAKMPVTSLTMLLATCAIAGVPFFSGFYSKDAILASALIFVREPAHAKHALLLVLPVVGALLTAFYMFRMWYLLFSGTSRSASAEHEHEHEHDSVHAAASHGHGHHGDPVAHAHESPLSMALPLVLLAIPAVMIGWPWLVVPLSGTPVLEQLLAASAPVPVHHHAMEVQLAALSLSLLIAGLGIFLASLYYFWHRLDASATARRLAPVYGFLRHKWYFDELYDRVFIRPTLALARGCSEFDRRVIDRVVNGSALLTRATALVSSLFDRRAIDGMVTLVADIVGRAGVLARLVQTGKVRQYVMMLVVGLVALFWGVYRWILG